MENNRGFIKFLIIIIAAVILLNYFNIDLRHWVEKLQLKPLFNKLWLQIVVAWHQLVDIWRYLTN